MNHDYYYNYFAYRWGVYNVKDPGGQLAWLIEELSKAERRNQSVHIVGHVPPAGAICNKVWSRNFYNIVSR
jgi:sphingomyelin phosphodiesterase